MARRDSSRWNHQAANIGLYCIFDIVLRTKAGEVILEKTHIDVLQGPEEGNLPYYIGKAEERRLGLTSFKEQVENLAEEIKNGTRKQPGAPKKAKDAAAVQESRVKLDGKYRTVRFEASKQPSYKRRLRLGKRDDLHGSAPGEIKAYGYAFAGEENWKALQRTPYVMDPMVDGLYVTTAAVAGRFEACKRTASRTSENVRLVRENTGMGGQQ